MSADRVSTKRRAQTFASTAVTSALLMSLSTGAPAKAPKPDLTITVFGEHYMFAGRVIDDLDVLEDAVRARAPDAIRLDACGRAADYAQRAAAHRFRGLNLELRLLGPDTSACRPTSDARQTRTSARRSQPPFGIDHEAVDNWWHRSMP